MFGKESDVEYEAQLAGEQSAKNERTQGKPQACK